MDAEGKTEATAESLTIPMLTHTHTLTHVDEIPATETTEGTKEHWHCNDCGKDFLDEHGKQEATADDLKTGMLEKEVQSGANALTATLATSKEELITAVLTEEDKAKIDAGKDIKIVLQIENQPQPATEDKTAVENAIGGLTNYKIGQYLDVNLFKVIGDEQSQITTTNAALTISFEVPAALRGSGRTYSVIRVHDGKTTVLEDKDKNPNTVTIETDKFSTYALAYHEEKTTPTTPSESDPGENTSDDNASSGENSGNNTSSNGTSNNNVSNSNTSNDDISNNSNSTSGESTPPTESSPSEGNNNPATGITVSFVPLAVAVTVLMAAKRKKK